MKSLFELSLAYHRFMKNLRMILPVMLIAGIVAVLVIPALRESTLLYFVGRDGLIGEPGIRKFGLRLLAHRESDRVIRNLVYMVNTLGHEPGGSNGLDEEIANAAYESIIGATGEDFGSGNEEQRLDALNHWASGRFGESLDENGSVLGWYQVIPSFNEAVETIASKDPEEAYGAWRYMFSINFSSWTELVVAVGPALADSRPLSFAIRPGDSSYGPGLGWVAFQMKSEPIDTPGTPLLAHTVADAIALILWQRIGDRHGEELPADFAAWYAEHARAKRLPPRPDP
jgi:hypothetical protein